MCTERPRWKLSVIKEYIAGKHHVQREGGTGENVLCIDLENLGLQSVVYLEKWQAETTCKNCLVPLLNAKGFRYRP